VVGWDFIGQFVHSWCGLVVLNERPEEDSFGIETGSNEKCLSLNSFLSEWCVLLYSYANIS